VKLTEKTLILMLQAIELHNQGFNESQIAKETGVGISLVARVMTNMPTLIAQYHKSLEEGESQFASVLPQYGRHNVSTATLQ